MNKKIIFAILTFIIAVPLIKISAQTEEKSPPESDVIQNIRQKLADRAKEQQEIEKMKEESIIEQLDDIKARKEKKKALKKLQKTEIENIQFPTDNTTRFTVEKIQIVGNILLSDEYIIEHIPPVFNTSDMPLEKAPSLALYDFRPVIKLLNTPGSSQQLSARTIKGLTRFILALYMDQNYAGIYVYVPNSAVSNNKLHSKTLPINIIEAKISDVSVSYFDFEQNQIEKGYLLPEIVKEWNPAKPGKVANEKKLSEYVSLLNLNPDRYVSSVVSESSDPCSLSLDFNIYEVDPWHFYLQLDNSGTDNTRWNPRFGIINTNITGRDDRLNLMWQGPVFENNNVIEPFEDNYTVFGSYEFPIFTPKLRLNLYIGHTSFEIGAGDTGGLASFEGNGDYWGGMLTYNLFQMPGEWFFDLLAGASQEYSQVTTTVGNVFSIPTDVEMNLIHTGFELHRTTEMATTSVKMMRSENIGGSDAQAFNNARTNADPEFAIYNVSAYHDQYFDPWQIHRMFGSIRFIEPNRRLVPAKMTTFGGLYTIRGYEEYEFVADGGSLFRLQYEFDLISKMLSDQHQNPLDQQQRPWLTVKRPWLDRLALAAFIDHGRGKTENHIAGERSVEEFTSIGMGTVWSVLDNFDGAIYYGFPLRGTQQTDPGDGRWHFTFIARW